MTMSFQQTSDGGRFFIGLDSCFKASVHELVQVLDQTLQVSKSRQLEILTQLLGIAKSSTNSRTRPSSEPVPSSPVVPTVAVLDSPDERFSIEVNSTLVDADQANTIDRDVEDLVHEYLMNESAESVADDPKTPAELQFQHWLSAYQAAVPLRSPKSASDSVDVLSEEEFMGKIE
jgi:hypothetical protein